MTNTVLLLLTLLAGASSLYIYKEDYRLKASRDDRPWQSHLKKAIAKMIKTTTEKQIMEQILAAKLLQNDKTAYKTIQNEALATQIVSTSRSVTVETIKDIWTRVAASRYLENSALDKAVVARLQYIPNEEAMRLAALMTPAEDLGKSLGKVFAETDSHYSQKEAVSRFLSADQQTRELISSLVTKKDKRKTQNEMTQISNEEKNPVINRYLQYPYIYDRPETKTNNKGANLDSFWSSLYPPEPSKQIGKKLTKEPNKSPYITIKSKPQANAARKPLEQSDSFWDTILQLDTNQNTHKIRNDATDVPFWDSLYLTTFNTKNIPNEGMKQKVTSTEATVLSTTGHPEPDHSFKHVQIPACSLYLPNSPNITTKPENNIEGDQKSSIHDLHVEQFEKVQNYTKPDKLEGISGPDVLRDLHTTQRSVPKTIPYKIIDDLPVITSTDPSKISSRD